MSPTVRFFSPVVSVTFFFLFYEAIGDVRSRHAYFFILLCLNCIPFFYIKQANTNAGIMNSILSASSGVLIFITYFLREYLEFPSTPGFSYEASVYPRLRDFLLVILVCAYLYSFLVALTGFLGLKSLEVQSSLEASKKKIINSMLFEISILLLLVIAVNYFAYKKNFHFDLSSQHKYSYSRSSRNIIKNIQKKIEIFAFYPRPLESSGPTNTLSLSIIRPDVEIVLEQLRSLNPNITLKFINADAEPESLADIGQVSNGNILFRTANPTGSGSNLYLEQKILIQEKQDLEDAERKIIQALTAITSPEQEVFFITSNGERFGSGFLNTPNERISRLTGALSSLNWKVQPLGFEEKWPIEIPKKAKLIALIGPTVKLNKPQQEKLLDFVIKEKGKVLITVDPFGDEDFSWILEKAAYKLTKATLSQQNGRPGLIVAKQLNKHPIEDSITKKQLGVIYPFGGFFEPLPGGKNDLFQISILLETGSDTFLDLNKNAKPDKGERLASFPLGILMKPKTLPQTIPDKQTPKEMKPPGISPKEEEGAIIIYSGTSWITDQFTSYNINLPLAVNSFAWLGKRESTEELIPKKEEVLNITLSDKQKLIVWIFGMFGFPGLVTISGFLYVLKRKKG